MVNSERVGILTDRLTTLVGQICDVSQVIDYPWTEVYGQATPPAFNEKSLGLVQPIGGYRGGADPTVSGLAGPSKMKETEIRADTPVSFARATAPEALVKPAVVLRGPVALLEHLAHVWYLAKKCGVCLIRP